MKLYVRFFSNKENQIPDNSEFIKEFGEDLNPNSEIEFAEMVSDWMEKYQNGKVDYIWLTNGI